jgi:hypothetical protein
MTDPYRIVICPRCGDEVEECDFDEGIGQRHVKGDGEDRTNPYCHRGMACWVLRILRKDGCR